MQNIQNFIIPVFFEAPCMLYDIPFITFFLFLNPLSTRNNKILFEPLCLWFIILFPQVPAISLLSLAKSEINWPFSLRSLLNLRPCWILLASARYLIGCLCEKCHNTSLRVRFLFFIHIICFYLQICRALKTFLDKCSQGSAVEKSTVMSLPIISSLSSLIDILLHPIVSQYVIICSGQ